VLALIGLRSQDLRGHNRNPRPASPGSTTEVETVHPLLSCAASTVRSAVQDRTRITRSGQPGFPPAARVGMRRAGRGLARSRPGTGAGPARDRRLERQTRMKMAPASRWRWPKHARRGRPAGSEPVYWPGLPRDEARTLNVDWAATPERTPVTRKDARGQRYGCLLGVTFSYGFIT